MMEGHSRELLVSESDWKSVPSGRSRSSKTTRTEADGPGCRDYQVTTHGQAQITTAGVLRNWLTHGDLVTRCDAVQTVEHQDTQLVGKALTYWQPVQNITKRVRLSLSGDQSCRSIENSLACGRHHRRLQGTPPAFPVPVDQLHCLVVSVSATISGFAKAERDLTSNTFMHTRL